MNELKLMSKMKTQPAVRLPSRPVLSHARGPKVQIKLLRVFSKQQIRFFVACIVTAYVHVSFIK
jgi:hypothetical protein